MKIMIVSICCFLAAIQFCSASPVIDQQQDQQQEQCKIRYIERLSPSAAFANIKHIGGLDVDGNDNLVVFHRGSRRWDMNSFIGNEFNAAELGTIKENVLDVINPNTYETILSTGADTYYMPHGVHVDYDGYVWLTDVGLHQVIKLSPKDLDSPVMTLGTRLESGSDSQHFCKPTGVIVSRTTGDIFVSDGYCNQRVVQFDKDGKFVREFKDEAAPMLVVHSITLLESMNLVCAASREDGRIVCFDIESGEKKQTIKDEENMRTVYAMKYDPINEVIQAVSGENHQSMAVGLTFDATSFNFGKLLKIWKPKKITLKEAHDLAISLDGSKVYTGQLNGEIDEFEFERLN